MEEPRVRASQESPTEVACDVLLVGAHQGDDRRPVLAGDGALGDFSSAVLEHLGDGGFKGKVGDVAVVPSLGRLPARAVAVTGLGPRAQAGPAELRRAAGAAARRLGDYQRVAIALGPRMPEEITCATEGFLLGLYRFDGYKTDVHPRKITDVAVLGATDKDVERAVAIAAAVATARDLVNEPASVLTPARLAARARELAEDGSLECEVVEGDALIAGGFGGITGVGQGSAAPPCLIKLRYSPQSAAGKVALVGKGITFDSGGLSLKDAKGLETMKTDMSGAAAVLATMSVLARVGARVEVLGYLAAAENMPASTAIKPGDVITHYGGKTTEVVNTDAEGRLVLADALTLACEQKPDALVDVATLTGSIVVALGRKASGLFSNNADLQDELMRASRAAGERFWPMPLYDDYAKELESEVADLKNLGGRHGGAIVAAVFLKKFVAEGVPWAHLDIAGTARADSDSDEIPKGGTGVATNTLIRWIEGRSG